MFQKIIEKTRLICFNYQFFLIIKNEGQILNLDIKGIVIICGNYGSGKTETAVNLAVKRRQDGLEVNIADLDLVNPYFRAREARSFLEGMDISLILPDKQYMHADLPILVPAVAGVIKQPSELTILDAGGDNVGVTVLAALENHLTGRQIHMLQVINPFRPFTENVEGCIRIKEEIEKSSKLKVTGLVGNANLINETVSNHIYKGYDFLKEVSEETGLKLEFITASSDLISRLNPNYFSCPVLEIKRKMLPPWKRA
jgi:hypothetical protein